MAASLSPAAVALEEAGRSLERVFADTRSQWDDAARHAFDRRFADPIQAIAFKSAKELQQLGRDLAAAVRTLDSLG